MRVLVFLLQLPFVDITLQRANSGEIQYKIFQLKQMNIKAFIQKIISENSNKAETYSLGKLTDIEVAILLEKTGLDLSGYERVIDKYGVLHAFVKHGNSKLEESRGQIAINLSDFELIPDIISNPDRIDFGELNSHGKMLIKYFKLFDCEYIYIEEKRDGKKQLATQTFYKKKIRK